MNEKIKEKTTWGKPQTFWQCKDYEEWKDQRGLEAKLISFGFFFNFASIYFVCLQVNARWQNDGIALCDFYVSQCVMGPNFYDS